MCQKPQLLVAPNPTLEFFLTHFPLQDFLTALKKGTLQISGGVRVEVLRSHTSLSFGITTEKKQPSHLHEKGDVMVGVCVYGRGGVQGTVGLNAGKKTWEKTDNNAVIYPHK